MKKIIMITMFLTFSTAFAESFYDFKFQDTNGKPINFDAYKGKVVLLVNIATRCGFSGQLEDLEKVYTKYKEKNLIILGVPSNNFLSQTPEENKEVGNVCRLKYGANFPILEKQEVIGDKKSSLFKWVHSQKGFEGKILWNFEKFIIDKNGMIVDRFRSMTNPSDESFQKTIEKYL